MTDSTEDDFEDLDNPSETAGGKDDTDVSIEPAVAGDGSSVSAEESVSENVPDHPDVKIMPPMLLLLAVIGGIVLDWLIPLNVGHWAGWIGLLLLGASVFVVYQCKTLFDRAGTNLPPNMPVRVLVTQGPYKYSRNPIYAAFLAGYAGLALMADAPLMLLLTGGLFYVLDKYVIDAEEEYLAAKFGDVYTDYTDKVRRWV